MFKKQGSDPATKIIEVVPGDFSKIAENLHLLCRLCGKQFRAKNPQEAIEQECEECRNGQL